jgi:hypothetical protein
VNGSRKLLAALLLLAWLGAGLHLALEHGGAFFVTHLNHEAHCADPHECGGLPGEPDHHHHHLTAATAARCAPAIEHIVKVRFWQPLDETLRAAFALLLRDIEPGNLSRAGWDAPPDPRAAGWLFAVRTAFPVRAPAHSV